MIKNPFSIVDLGLILSFSGTSGILFFNKIITCKLNEKNGKENPKILQKIKNLIGVSISAQIAILPIVMISYNGISTLFIISNILTSEIIGIIIILGFVCVIIPIKPFFYVLNLLISLLNFISKTISNIPFSYIKVVTPNIFLIIIYYVIVVIAFIYLYLKNKKNKRFTQKKILALYSKIWSKLKCNKKQIIIVLIISCLGFYAIEANFRAFNIYFVDVGQGDSTLIVTSTNKKILIDTGGSTNKSEFNIGKNVLVPYLLNRGVMKLDYVLISHFDADHCEALSEVINSLIVKNLIISKQCKITNEYKEIINLVKKKNIKVVVVEEGDEINLDKYTSIEILYPKKNLKFDDLNNNSIVCKLNYRNFSMLFTGDIEKVAETEIIKQYNNSNKLRANILKVAHHGSKTSTTKEYLEAVKPQYALIGVGKDNKFGHPNDEVIERLKDLRNKNL